MIVAGIIVALAGAVIIYAVSAVSSAKKRIDFSFNLDPVIDIIHSAEADIYNSEFEYYSGIKYGSTVNDLLGTVAANNKKNKNIITVEYNSISASSANEILNIADSIDKMKEYKVLLDYNENGYVCKITISAGTGINNSDFEFFSGRQFGITVNVLLNKAASNNKTNSHKITVEYNGISAVSANEISDITDSIDPAKDYKVALDYDEKGNVYKITITAAASNTNNASPDFFNFEFEFYSGSQKGLFVQTLLNLTAENNRKNSSIITVVYNGSSASSADKILDFSGSLDMMKDYKVTLGYDEDGYVNKITIK